jgi:hypothetical protein
MQPFSYGLRAMKGEKRTSWRLLAAQDTPDERLRRFARHESIAMRSCPFPSPGRQNRGFEALNRPLLLFSRLLTAGGDLPGYRAVSGAGEAVCCVPL